MTYVVISTFGNVKLYTTQHSNPIADALRTHCAYMLETGEMESLPTNDTKLIRTLEDYFGDDLVCSIIDNIISL
jgi:hypothetical protein